MTNTPITEQSLIAAGYERQTFFFQTGGGEDEDDMEIFVKNGIAVAYESTYECWYAVPESEINYVDGFNLETATRVESMEDLHKM